MTDENKMTLQDALDDPTTEGAVVMAQQSQVALLSDAEINRQITTAKAYPRSVSTFRKKTLELVTLSESVATECVYALPRGGKTIEGPSVRFAEIIQHTWGNNRTGTRVVGEDNLFVIAQAAFHDLESNNAMTLEIRRRITGSNGRRFNEDMIGVTGSAASSIALRNVILRCVPKALWFDMYVAARKVVAGDFETLPNRRAAALKAFVIYGIKAEQIYAALGVKGTEDIGIEHMITLAGFLNALKDGSAKPEDFFNAGAPTTRPEREEFETPKKTTRARKPKPDGESKSGPATVADGNAGSNDGAGGAGGSHPSVDKKEEKSPPVAKAAAQPKPDRHPNAPPEDADEPAAVEYSDALTVALDAVAEATTPITLDRILKETELAADEMVVLNLAVEKRRRAFK